jgi:hypothetical protein
MNDILGNLVTKFSIMDLLSIFNHPKIVLKKPKKKKKKKNTHTHTHTHTHTTQSLFIYLILGGFFFWLTKMGDNNWVMSATRL